MADQGGEDEIAQRRERQEKLPPQDFSRVRKLWRRMCEAFPEAASSGGGSSSGSAAPATPPDPLLTALQEVWCAAWGSYMDGDHTINEKHAVVDPESKAHATLAEKRELAGELLEMAGWQPEGNTWRLAKPISAQLLRASAHFVEVKLGVAPTDPQHELVMPMFANDEPAPSAELVSPDCNLNLGELLQRVSEEYKLPEKDQLKTICHRARDIMVKEDNVVEIDAPCTLVGDIHGQFWDLQKVFKDGGDPATTRYVFLGDLVDRGEHSLLCLAHILLLKLLYPDNIVVLRGNHESRGTNGMYGFHSECEHCFPSAEDERDNDMWLLFNHLFDAMPLAAVVGSRIFCCHGGLSPQLPTLDRMLTFDRIRDIIPPAAMADLTWSDPGVCEGWHMNARGSGYLFGEDVSKEFCTDNHLLFVCRAHQCVKEGFKWEHGGYILTVFSAPNYCGQENRGAILLLGEKLEEDLRVYEEAERPDGQPHRSQAFPVYFQGAVQMMGGDQQSSGGTDEAASEEKQDGSSGG